MRSASRSIRVATILATVSFLSLAAAGPQDAAPRPAGDQKITIAMIPKGTTHAFWKSVEAGARKAAGEQKVELIWKGPLKENDRAQQVQLVQQFVVQGVSGIAVAPLDFKALVKPVQAAGEKKIPVVIFDSALDAKPGQDYVSFVATDNRRGGELGGAELVRVLGGKGKVVLMRYQVGSASTDEREAGFLEAIKKSPDIKIISDNRYSGATVGEAKTAALNMMDQLKQAEGIFCPNESSTMGMLLALEQEGLAGKVKLVGFDASVGLVKGLKEGKINALVIQNPRKMGYESVNALVKHLRGEKVPERIDTGATVVTRENMDQPDIKPLIE